MDVGPLLDCWIYHAPPHDIYHAPPHDDNVVIITYGVTRLETGAFSISDEHKSVRVFPIEDIDHIPLPDGYRRAIRRWALMRNS